MVEAFHLVFIFFSFQALLTKRIEIELEHMHKT